MKRGTMYDNTNAIQFNFLQSYLEIANLLQTGLLWLDEEGRVLAANEQLKWELGYKPDIDFPQKTIFQITPYLTFIDWRKIWQQLVANKEFSFQAECITQSGAIYPVNVRAKLLQLPERDICFCLIENLLTARAYQELLEITSTITRVGSWQWNLIQNRLLLGKEVYSLLELSADFQSTAKSMLRLLYNITNPASFTLFKEKLKRCIATGEQLDMELAVTLPISQQNCQFRVVGVPTFTDGKTVNLYGAFQDISSIATRTDQMYLMEYAVEHAFEMIYWVEPDGKISYVNERTCEILGYSREELLHLINYKDVVSDPATWISWDPFKKQKVWQGEISLKAKDGTIIPVYTIGNYTRYRDQELACIFTRDLREEKKRERLSQVTQHLLNQASDMIYWHDQEGIIQYVNQIFCEKVGYKSSEIIGKNILFFYPQYGQQDAEKNWEILRSGQSVLGEYTMTGKGGKEIPVETNVSLISYEGNEYCCGIVRDLTERRQQEKELQERNRAFQISNYALSKTSELIYWIRMDGSFISVNPVFCEKSGYSEAELLTKNVNDLFVEEPAEILQERWRRVNNGEFIRGEAIMTCKDGTLLPVKFHVTQTELDEERCLCGVLTDISTLKHLEAELQRRGNLPIMTREALEAMTDLVYCKRPDGSLLAANAVFFDKLGYLPEELPLIQIDKIYENFDWNASLQRWNNILRTGLQTGELVLLAKDGTRLEASFQASAVDYNGAVAAYYVVCEKRKGTIKDAKSEQERIRELTARIPVRANDLIYWTNQDGIILYANENYAKALGYEIEEIIGKHVLHFYPTVTPEQAAMGFEMIRQAKNISGEAVLTTRDGEKIPVEQSASFVEIDGGAYFSIVLHDLTEQKRKDEELSERNRLLDITRYSLNHANEMIYWLDSTGAFLHFNETMCEKLGYTESELKQMSLRELFGSEPENAAQAWATLRKKESLQGERLIFRKNGSSFPVEYYVVPVTLDDELCVCGRLTDVSERKQKEKELKHAFEQINSMKEQLESENLVLKEDIKLQHNFNNIISTSEAYKKVLKQVEQVADTEATVLILGETGTGKELLARALHQLSRRVNRPMVKVNCGALPDNLIESELFGHEKGAFTGAYQQKKGRFELADKGTIFLDEIGELPLDLQTKLLRVLQEGEFERVGATQTTKVNVRVIAATNRNLEQLVQEGKFRQDLFYRLNVFPIYNIPLRERREDIPLLVSHFVEKFSNKTGKKITAVSQKTMSKLKAYNFPGNVRELENIIERAVILSVDQTLETDGSFSSFPQIKSEESTPTDGTFKSLEELQRDYIIRALRQASGQISGEEGAAKLLQMNDKTLYSKIKKLNIARHEYLS